MRYLKNKLRELFVKRETLVFIILTLIIYYADLLIEIL